MSKHKAVDDYLSFTTDLIGSIACKHGMTLVKHGRSAMGEWYVNFESAEFVLGILQDRGGDVGIEVGTKIRRKPKAHMRGPWSMCHLRGYLEGSQNHVMFSNPKDESLWLERNQDVIFDSRFLNSEELNTWAIAASRKLFGNASKQ